MSGPLRECLVPIEAPENAHALHTLVHRIMNPDALDAPRDYIFSLDPSDPLAAGQTVLVIRSCALPTALDSRAVDTHIPGVGESLDFLLRASPSVKGRLSATTDTQMGVKGWRPIKDEPGRRKWLETQAQKHGFFLGDFEIAGSRPIWVSRPTGESRSRKWALNDVSYAGRLTVTNAKAFEMALNTGIGREKAYGFGLLTIFP